MHTYYYGLISQRGEAVCKVIQLTLLITASWKALKPAPPPQASYEALSMSWEAFTQVAQVTKQAHGGQEGEGQVGMQVEGLRGQAGRQEGELRR